MRTPTLLCSLLAASLLVTPCASAQALGPSAPANVVAAATAPGEITLAWNASSSLLGVTAYRVYHVEADGNLTRLVDVPADQLGVVESGLAPGVTVAYAVAAVDALGEGPASDVAVATTWSAPGAPTGVAATSGPGLVGEATVSWSAPETDGGAAVLAYHVYRDGALVATLDASTLAWTDTGLTPLEPHSYAVSALNAVGEGPLSEGACGMPSPWTAELGCGRLL